jgi:hypothetical protein
VHILHGADGGEEHRNMPVDKAVSLIARDFERYLADGGRRRSEPIEALPPHVETLLQLLAQSKPLTAMQYDALSAHLTSRRQTQARLEIGAPVPTAVPAVVAPVVAAAAAPANAAAELQQRIMSIMAQKLAPAPAPAPTPLLQDPKVRAALSSLFPM